MKGGWKDGRGGRERGGGGRLLRKQKQNRSWRYGADNEAQEKRHGTASEDESPSTSSKPQPLPHPSPRAAPPSNPTPEKSCPHAAGAITTWAEGTLSGSSRFLDHRRGAPLFLFLFFSHRDKRQAARTRTSGFTEQARTPPPSSPSHPPHPCNP